MRKSSGSNQTEMLWYDLKQIWNSVMCSWWMMLLFPGNTSSEDLDRLTEKFLNTDETEEDSREQEGKEEVTVSMTTTRRTMEEGRVKVPNAAAFPVCLVRATVQRYWSASEELFGSCWASSSCFLWSGFDQSCRTCWSRSKLSFDSIYGHADSAAACRLSPSALCKREWVWALATWTSIRLLISLNKNNLSAEKNYRRRQNRCKRSVDQSRRVCSCFTCAEI